MTVPPRPLDPDEEAAAWADTMRIALNMARARRDGRREDYWRLFDGLTLDRSPLVLQCLADLCGAGRDDDFFASRLAGLGRAEASGSLAEGVREWMAEWGLGG
jgi:hypothetical protein